MKILITGAGGFVGSNLCTRLKADNDIISMVRVGRGAAKPELEGTRVLLGDLGRGLDLRSDLEGVDAVVHCAARVHQLGEGPDASLEKFREVNCFATAALARQSAEVGVRRFIFVSSIGVNGVETFGQPFRACDHPSPRTSYAKSKEEAEGLLRIISSETGLEVVVVRPPLVYGAGAPGNFGSLMKAVVLGVPLPFGMATRNRRDFVYIENLTDLLARTLEHPSAVGRTFLVSDGESLSTSDLVKRIGAALGRNPRLVSVPRSLIRAAAFLIGKSHVASQLLGSLEVDIGATKEALGWAPRWSVEEGLSRSAAVSREF